jgi:carbonic anhydrase
MPTSWHRWFGPFVLLGGALGCSQAAADTAHAPPAASGSAAPSPHAASASEPGDEHGGHAPGHGESGAVPAEPHEVEHRSGRGRLGIPFAWEASQQEPLARTRLFLASILSDNAETAALGRKHFAPFLDKQTPRATVVTCSDSRVQVEAWDKTAENDQFVIRNIGNQLANAEGSVEYGVEHLHTPLLLVVGHTGCGAVKAAMGTRDGLSGPIKRELEPLAVPKSKAGASEADAWTEAVIHNVNAQVERATKKYATEIRDGELTVVGAVYDFRNDLKRGFGKLVVVNVNSNTATDRMQAFVTAAASVPPGLSAQDARAREADGPRASH